MNTCDLSDSDDESHSSSDGRILSLGSEEHLSVRPTTLMGTSVSIEHAPTQKKRKRTILDYVLIPSLSMMVRSTSNSSRSRGSSKAIEMGKTKEEDADRRLPVDIETVCSNY